MSTPPKLQYQTGPNGPWHDFFYNGSEYVLVTEGKAYAIRLAPKRSAEEIVEKLKEVWDSRFHSLNDWKRILDGDF